MNREPVLNVGQLLPEQIARHISKLIVRQAQPGAKLPTEPELVDMFGVSRPTIREAVKILVANNIVKIVRGKGTFVCQNPGLVDDPLGIRFIRDRDLVVFLQESRVALEPGVAYLAAQRRQGSDLEQIRRVLGNMIASTQANRLDMDDELAFHTLVTQAAHNPVLSRLIPLITESVTSTYVETRQLLSSHRRAAQAHQKIYDAIERQDAEIAREMMRTHLEETLAELRQVLAKSAVSIGTDSI